MGDNVDDPNKPLVATTDMIFQKPWQESLLIRYPTQIVRTALDGYEAWRQLQNITAGGQQEIDPNHASQVVMLNRGQIENLRADTWYHRPFPRHRGGGWGPHRRGPGDDRWPCLPRLFTYSPAVVYTRYFDRSTGRLVYTETNAGGRIRESGEVIVGGIRFPKTIVTSQSNRGGSSTYIFDKITLNETFPASFFAMPLSRVSDEAKPLLAP